MLCSYLQVPSFILEQECLASVLHPNLKKKKKKSALLQPNYPKETKTSGAEKDRGNIASSHEIQNQICEVLFEVQRQMSADKVWGLVHGFHKCALKVWVQFTILLLLVNTKMSLSAAQVPNPSKSLPKCQSFIKFTSLRY